MMRKALKRTAFMQIPIGKTDRGSRFRPMSNSMGKLP
jgi:hypothetical protein